MSTAKELRAKSGADLQKELDRAKAAYDELLRGCLERSPGDRPTLDELRAGLLQGAYR